VLGPEAIPRERGTSSHLSRPRFGAFERSGTPNEPLRGAMPLGLAVAESVSRLCRPQVQRASARRTLTDLAHLAGARARGSANDTGAQHVPASRTAVFRRAVLAEWRGATLQINAHGNQFGPAVGAPVRVVEGIGLDSGRNLGCRTHVQSIAFGRRSLQFMGLKAGDCKRRNRGKTYPMCCFHVLALPFFALRFPNGPGWLLHHVRTMTDGRKTASRL